MNKEKVDKAEDATNLDRLMKLEEVADVLGMSRHTLYRRVAPGCPTPFPLKPKRIGRSLRFSEKQVQEFIRSLK